MAGARYGLEIRVIAVNDGDGDNCIDCRCSLTSFHLFIKEETMDGVIANVV